MCPFIGGVCQSALRSDIGLQFVCRSKNLSENNYWSLNLILPAREPGIQNANYIAKLPEECGLMT